MSSIENNKQVDIIYLDYASAFISVVHAKLIYKLEAIGICGLVLNWIKAFLSGRVQRVKVESCLSSPMSVLSGVPQGRVLGPLLFAFFINDICSIQSTVVMKLFADDLKIYSCISDQYSWAIIQNLLDEISKWSDLWQLTLSPAKSAVLSLGRHVIHYSYQISNHCIARVTCMKDLGLMIDQYLNFDLHINLICTIANQHAALLLKSFQSRDPQTLFKAFTTFVRPTLEYASNVWNPMKVTSINKIESVQRRFTKKLSGLSNLCYSDRLAALNSVTLEERRLRLDLNMYFNIIHKLVDIDYCKYFIVSHNVHTTSNAFKTS
jgi:hypothetical protein